MKNNNICKVIHDLLPNYIENLTSEETNNFIESHLQECDDCQEVLELMKNGINNNGKVLQKKEIKYLELFKKRMQRLKLIIIFILILIIAFFGISLVRKYTILLDISNKSKQEDIHENSHIVEYYYVEGYMTKMEQYKLGDKIKSIYSIETPEGIMLQTTFKDKDGGNTFIEYKNKKYVCLNYASTGRLVNDSVLTTEKRFDLLKYAFNTTITKTKFRDKECYLLTNIPAYIGGKYERVYIDRENGLMIGASRLDSEMPVESVYEYNTVNNDEFIEPNLSEYKIINYLDEIYK